MECRKLRWQDYPLMCPRPSQGCLVKKSVPTPSLSCALYFKAKLGGLSLNISLLSFWSGMQSHLLLGWRKAFDRLWLDSFEKDRILQKKLTINSPKNRKPKQESQNSTSHENIQSGKMLAQWRLVKKCGSPDLIVEDDLLWVWSEGSCAQWSPSISIDEFHRDSNLGFWLNRSWSKTFFGCFGSSFTPWG